MYNGCVLYYIDVRNMCRSNPLLGPMSESIIYLISTFFLFAPFFFLFCVFLFFCGSSQLAPCESHLLHWRHRVQSTGAFLYSRLQIHEHFPGPAQSIVESKHLYKVLEDVLGSLCTLEYNIPVLGNTASPQCVPIKGVHIVALQYIQRVTIVLQCTVDRDTSIQCTLKKRAFLVWQYLGMHPCHLLQYLPRTKYRNLVNNLKIKNGQTK